MCLFGVLFCFVCSLWVCLFVCLRQKKPCMLLSRINILSQALVQITQIRLPTKRRKEFIPLLMENQIFLLHVSISTLTVNVKLQRWSGSISVFLYGKHAKWHNCKWMHIYRLKWQVCIYLMVYRILEYLKNLKIWVHPFRKESF